MCICLLVGTYVHMFVYGHRYLQSGLCVGMCTTSVTLVHSLSNTAAISLDKHLDLSPLLHCLYVRL